MNTRGTANAVKCKQEEEVQEDDILYLSFGLPGSDEQNEQADLIPINLSECIVRGPASTERDAARCGSRPATENSIVVSPRPSSARHKKMRKMCADKPSPERSCYTKDDVKDKLEMHLPCKDKSDAWAIENGSSLQQPHMILKGGIFVKVDAPKQHGGKDDEKTKRADVTAANIGFATKGRCEKNREPENKDRRIGEAKQFQKNTSKRGFGSLVDDEDKDGSRTTNARRPKARRQSTERQCTTKRYTNPSSEPSDEGAGNGLPRMLPVYPYPPPPPPYQMHQCPPLPPPLPPPQLPPPHPIQHQQMYQYAPPPPYPSHHPPYLAYQYPHPPPHCPADKHQSPEDYYHPSCHQRMTQRPVGQQRGYGPSKLNDVKSADDRKKEKKAILPAGVTKQSRNCWTVSIGFGGKRQYVGSFNSERKAILAAKVFRANLPERWSAKTADDIAVAARKAAEDAARRYTETQHFEETGEAPVGPPTHDVAYPAAAHAFLLATRPKRPTSISHQTPSMG